MAAVTLSCGGKTYSLHKRLYFPFEACSFEVGNNDSAFAKRPPAQTSGRAALENYPVSTAGGAGQGAQCPTRSATEPLVSGCPRPSSGGLRRPPLGSEGWSFGAQIAGKKRYLFTGNTARLAAKPGLPRVVAVAGSALPGPAPHFHGG